MASQVASPGRNGDVQDPSSLLSLPVEILVKLPSFLHDIEDFMNLSSSCRTLYNLYSTTSPNLIFQLAAAASRVFFRPSPHLLIAAVARQVGEWAVESKCSENQLAFHDSFRTEGIDGLFKLCLRIGRLSMDDIRNLYEFKLSVLNPLSHQLSLECGPLSTHALPREQQEPDEEYWTICEDPDISLLQVAIFGDLFAASVRSVYDPQEIGPLSPRMRRDWWAQCCPDINCDASPKENEERGICNLEMLSLHDMLISSFWREGWEKVHEAFGNPFPFSIEFDENELNRMSDAEMKNKIWEQTLKGQGLSSLELLRPGGVEKIRPLLEKIREKIAVMDVTRFGDIEDREADHTWSVRVSAVSDIYVCLGWT